MSSHDSDEPELTRQQELAHDIHNCLHVIAEGLEVLRLVRNDTTKFEETCAAIQKERRQASKLVNELANL